MPCAKMPFIILPFQCSCCIQHALILPFSVILRAFVCESYSRSYSIAYPSQTSSNYENNVRTVHFLPLLLRLDIEKPRDRMSLRVNNWLSLTALIATYS